MTRNAPEKCLDYRETGPVKLRPVHFVELVFSHAVKGIKIKVTAEFCASNRLCFEDKKRIVSPEMHPKSFGTFEKPALV